MIFVLTGEGKGKTTCAIGMGIRAKGAGKKVLMVRFLKPKSGSSEDKVIDNIKNFHLKSFGRKGFFLPPSILKENPSLEEKGVKALGREDIELAQKAFNLTQRKAQSGKYQLVILDEVCVSLKFNLLKLEEVINFLEKYGKKLDLVLTGRECPSKIKTRADLITNFKEEKHYYKKRQQAKRGIEF